jgi:hypothetical protein
MAWRPNTSGASNDGAEATLARWPRKTLLLGGERSEEGETAVATAGR